VRGASFTERALAELATEPPPRPCCRRALVEGMRLGSGDGEIITTRLAAARSALAALHADGVGARVEVVAAPRRHRYVLRLAAGSALPEASSNPCCGRARLRGLLLAAGSLSRPEGPPHGEFLVGSQGAAATAAAELRRIGVRATILHRRGRLVVAVRSTEGLATLLTSVGAQQARLELEAGRVVGEVRSGVSRRLNAETANLRRTALAAVAQLEAVDRLRRDGRGLDALPPALREAAMLRRRWPAASLGVLAAAAGCSRPAMANRLRRLAGLANVETVVALGPGPPAG
jgi:DNA-binding transcriptional regulator WhiA